MVGSEGKCGREGGKEGVVESEGKREGGELIADYIPNINLLQTLSQILADCNVYPR